MITATTLAAYLDDLLACATFNDYAPNGLQVEGSKAIQRICTAVTASAEVITQAVALQADALLVHHGYFWRGEDAVITGIKRARLGQLFAHNLSLFAYHLPLDCHPELGNNAQLAKLLAVNAVKMHPAAQTNNLLWSGILPESKTADDFSQLLKQKLARMPMHIAGNNKPIQQIAWCSGAAQDFIIDAHALGVDAYLSGEIAERTYYQAQELGIHYFACGHHATERYGIQALGEHLVSQFALQHHFIDSLNPV